MSAVAFGDESGKKIRNRRAVRATAAHAGAVILKAGGIVFFRDAVRRRGRGCDIERAGTLARWAAPVLEQIGAHDRIPAGRG